MSDKLPDDAAMRALAAEAASIIRRLDADPHDPDAMDARDTFLARGDAEQRIYARMLRAISGTSKGIKKRDRRFGFAFLGLLLVSLFLLREPLRILAVADARTGTSLETVVLTSGDLVVLDAQTAIADDTAGEVRNVELLQGAAFFDVDVTGQRFVVSVGTATVEALGTSFAVSKVKDATIISVEEGVVAVRTKDQVIELVAGERVRLVSGAATSLLEIPTDSVAAWRQDRLTVEGLTFGDVVAILDRRLSGRVVVARQSLANAPLRGGIDLTSPMDALNALAATSGASVIQLPVFLTVVR